MAHDRTVRAREPLGRAVRGILFSGLGAVTFAALVGAMCLVFLAYEQSRWSGEFWAVTIFWMLVIGAAWMAVVHLPIWLAHERRGWNRYACLALQIVVLVVVVPVAVLLWEPVFTATAVVLLFAILLLPALAVGGAAGLAARSPWMRRHGWILWLAAIAICAVGWLVS